MHKKTNRIDFDLGKSFIYEEENETRDMHVIKDMTVLLLFFRHSRN